MPSSAAMWSAELPALSTASILVKALKYFTRNKRTLVASYLAWLRMRNSQAITLPDRILW